MFHYYLNDSMPCLALDPPIVFGSQHRYFMLCKDSFANLQTIGGSEGGQRSAALLFPPFNLQVYIGTWAEIMHSHYIQKYRKPTGKYKTAVKNAIYSYKLYTLRKITQISSNFCAKDRDTLIEQSLL